MPDDPGARAAAPPGQPPLEVAIVRARYNPFGGAERFVQRALAALSASELRVTIVARSWNEADEGAAPVPMRLERVDPFYLGSLWRDWSFARAVRRRLAGRGFAIVQSHERIPGLPLYRAGDGVHATYLDQRRRAQPGLRAALLKASPYHAYVLAAERAMFRHPALRAVICNSEMVRQDIHARFGVPLERLHLIRNGVDLQRFRPPDRAERDAARARFALDDARTVFAYVGSGYARKGVAPAIRALAAVDSALLLVAGTDRRERRYRALAERLGVADRVRFLGGQRDVRPVLHAADGFVLPTLYDPFPNAVLEAMASGLPAITSTTSGASEFIRAGENGFVVDALDEAGLAQAMRALCDPGQREARARAARAAVEGLSLDALAGELIGLYRRLLVESPVP